MAFIVSLAGYAQAQTNYQKLISFGSSSTNGVRPLAQLIEGTDGFLYGTTYQGGQSNQGTVFRIRKDATQYTVLRQFVGTNGGLPFGRLVESTNQFLYGTTSQGGSINYGVIFRMNKDGSAFSVLHSFGATADGLSPLAGLVLAKNGVLYGTTGGSISNNCGLIFKINQNGTGYAPLYYFHGTPANDGANPFTGLMQANDGMLYGTTQNGGSNSLGTIFKINPTGTGYAVIHHFAGGNDPRPPLGDLIQGSDGLLYGTSFYGGTNDLGTVYRLTTNGGNFTVLYNFKDSSNSSRPFGGVIEGPSGALYGTTQYGGPAAVGSAYRINKDGSGFVTLRFFTGAAGDGAQPQAALLAASDGALYGSTAAGGDSGGGILFKLFSPPSFQVTITRIRLLGGKAILDFAGGAAGQTYNIQARTNGGVGAWVVLGSTNAAGDGTFHFTDMVASNFPSRYYRSHKP